MNKNAVEQTSTSIYFIQKIIKLLSFTFTAYPVLSCINFTQLFLHINKYKLSLDTYYNITQITVVLSQISINALVQVDLLQLLFEQNSRRKLYLIFWDNFEKQIEVLIIIFISPIVKQFYYTITYRYKYYKDQNNNSLL